MERLRSENNKSDYSDDEDTINQSTNYGDGYENEYGMVDIMKPQQIKRELKTKAPAIRENKITFNNDDNFINSFNNIDNDLQSIDSLVVPSGSNSNQIKNTKTNLRKRTSKADQPQQTSRPKMIHTQKMRVPVEDGKRKTKTLITRTSAKDSHVEPVPTRISKRTTDKRIKNENQYVKDNMDLLLESSRKHLKFPEVVNDLEEIFRSPIKTRESNDEYITSDIHPPVIPKRTSKRNIAAPNRSAIQHRELSAKKTRQSAQTPLPETFNIKIEAEASFTSDDVFTCEMCSAVFRDRAQLLVHVPVHI